jgi:uncharacterized protein YbbC (DUF1343 family)
MPIDLIIGDRTIRKRLEELDRLDEIEASWQGELNQFKKIARKFHIYK